MKPTTLPETNIALENRWLEDVFPFWDGLFSEAMLVSERVTTSANSKLAK